MNHLVYLLQRYRVYKSLHKYLLIKISWCVIFGLVFSYLAPGLNTVCFQLLFFLSFYFSHGWLRVFGFDWLYIFGRFFIVFVWSLDHWFTNCFWILVSGRNKSWIDYSRLSGARTTTIEETAKREAHN